MHGGSGDPCLIEKRSFPFGRGTPGSQHQHGNRPRRQLVVCLTSMRTAYYILGQILRLSFDFTKPTNPNMPAATTPEPDLPRVDELQPRLPRATSRAMETAFRSFKRSDNNHNYNQKLEKKNASRTSRNEKKIKNKKSYEMPKENYKK